ncbi:alpha/beta fold hydrolase [Pseudonocardia nigra]|uniref:alpha/beta fold hydrolase n=1 Tax=Pseudonocardia nigra TaxID=1921578 RepID=UPI001C5EB478|nr:alpha/beta hydrolase [Pseudonocardia nigra]
MTNGHVLAHVLDDGAGPPIAWDRLGSGPPLVLGHGTPFSSAIWAPIARVLARRHTVYLWDMPGYGQSITEQADSVDLDAQARALLRLVAHWGIAAPDVVAHDIGGAVALRATVLHGLRPRSLFLADAVSVGGWGTALFRLLGSNEDVFAALPANFHRAIVHEYIASASASGLRPATAERLAQPWLTELGLRAFYRQMAQVGPRHTEDMEYRYGEIDCPVTVCWGEEDTWLPLDHGRELVTRIPGAELVLLPGAGHLVQEDDPAGLLGAITAHLDAR